MKIFSRNYSIRVGSTFSEEILLSDIWVTLDPALTYTVEAGMTLISDFTKKHVITGALSSGNTILTISMAVAVTEAITNLGDYNFAVDIATAGIVQTVLEGNILVQEDVSKPAV